MRISGDIGEAREDLPMPPLLLATAFDDLPDPRCDARNKLHLLTDILVIATRAAIAGAESREAIAEYGRTERDFFRGYPPPPDSIPGPDTFERVSAKLDPVAFARASRPSPATTAPSRVRGLDPTTHAAATPACPSPTGRSTSPRPSAGGRALRATWGVAARALEQADAAQEGLDRLGRRGRSRQVHGAAVGRRTAGPVMGRLPGPD
jgi:hypothetical protein